MKEAAFPTVENNRIHFELEDFRSLIILKEDLCI